MKSLDLARALGALAFVLAGVAACSPPTQTTDAGADPCAPEGHIHREDDGGAYCHCFGNYRGDGLRCVLRDGGTDAATAPDAADDAAPLDAPATTPDAIDERPMDSDGCGPHGHAHDDHCDCDMGYREVDRYCVPSNG